MSKKERSAEENSMYNYLRQEINKFVITEYGYYYLKPGQTNSFWIGVMPYKPELVEQLLQKVTNILNRETKPENKKTVFMVHVITDIAYYISEYANKAPDSINRNQTTKVLKQKLMAENSVLQGKFKFTKREIQQREKTRKKTARQIHSQVNNVFREMQNDFRHHWSR